MGSLFRSEPMALCQLFLQSDATYQCVAELGDLGLVQFIDLNADVNAFQRKFVNDIRRCDEMEYSLKYIEREIIKENVHIMPENPHAPMASPKDMVDMEAMYSKIEEELRQVNGNVAEMNKTYIQLVEVKHVLRSAGEFFESRNDIGESIENIDVPEDMPPPRKETLTSSHGSETTPANIMKDQDTLGFIAGMIPVERFQSFERLMWRVGKGVIIVQQMFIDEPIVDVHGEAQRKCVFIVFFPGKQLKIRIRKICEAFKANIYPCPANAEDRREAAIGVLRRLEDMRKVFNGSQDHRMKVLADAARNIRTWKIQVAKMKSVFHVMNMLNVDVTQKCLIAECWIPDRDMAKVQAALRRGTEAAGSNFPCIINRVDNDQSPPTFNRTTPFTSGFQALIDAYGVANYLEVNPAPYAIITFPFLFAVMFGDAGHGLLMALFASALIFFEKPLSRVREEMTSMIYGGRYLILLMGVFSIYTGLIYNDVFSKSLAIFKPTWILRDQFDVKKDPIGLRPEYDFSNRSYPFGLDPIWMIASNKIQFTNSYKMKMAVIMGVLHMTFGTVLSVWNHTFFKDRTGFPSPRTPVEAFLRRNLNIWAVFIPELMFLLSLFGYLVFMILYKWMLPFGAGGGQGPSCSRSILIMFINMVMQFGSVGDTEKSLCFQKPMFEGQSHVQMVILIIAFLAVPWLLLAKPFYLVYLNWVHSQPLPPDFVPIIFSEQTVAEDAEEGRSEASSGSSRRRKSAVSLHTLRNDDTDAQIAVSEERLEERSYDFDVGEVFIHQIIHTIEYCLGAVSNTASYLRLWALSLAHAQLSEVLWSMVFKGAVFAQADTSLAKHATTALMIALSWAGWAGLTVCILLLMEGLSAFLHALRLHWVEFMNKFFKGEGYPFTPFNFADVVRGVDDTDG